jgi:hypothetical protein
MCVLEYHWKWHKSDWKVLKGGPEVGTELVAWKPTALCNLGRLSHEKTATH